MKKVLFFILAALLCLFISCQSSQPVEQEQVAQQQVQGQVFLERETGKLQGQPWINSNVYGNWPESKPAVEENYELYVNYGSYMQAMNSNLTEDSLYDRSDEYQQTIIRQLIEDTSVTSDELELIRAYYGLFSDFDKRNTQGNDPLVEYRDMIVKKNNVEELSAEIQNGLVFGNPFATFAVNAAADGSGKYGVWIDFNLPITSKLEPGYTEEDLENVKAYLVYLLLLASYEQDFAVKMVNLLEDFEMKAFELDKKFVSENELENDAIILTLDEIKDFCTPLYDLIIGLGYYSADDPVCYFIRNAGMFYGIEQMYMDDNINIIDTIYVLSMAEYAKEFLDIKTFAEVNDIEDPETIDINEIAYSFITKYLSGAVDQVYLEFAFPADLRDKITELTKQYMAAMKERLEKEDWMSEETKASALDKLQQMISVVVYPDEWLDFSKLRELVQDHDQFLLDAVLCRDDYFREYITSFLGKEIERGNWVFSNTKTTEANAYYIPSENSINILAGILYDTLYYDNSTESILASIGATIGHEITHGFDTDGARYNGIGNEEAWWTQEDAAAFEAKANRVAEELSKIEVLDGCRVNGEFVLNEMIADLGGLALCLDLAKQYENFNYDEFFQYYAFMWYMIMPDAQTALNTYTEDNHPANYIRANFSVQMFDEFYETYPQVVEGTPMYRAPEDRVKLW